MKNVCSARLVNTQSEILMRHDVCAPLIIACACLVCEIKLYVVPTSYLVPRAIDKSS